MSRTTSTAPCNDRVEGEDRHTHGYTCDCARPHTHKRIRVRAYTGRYVRAHTHTSAHAHACRREHTAHTRALITLHPGSDPGPFAARRPGSFQGQTAEALIAKTATVRQQKTKKKTLQLSFAVCLHEQTKDRKRRTSTMEAIVVHVTPSQPCGFTPK